MFDVKTVLKLKGRNSTYEWTGRDAAFTAALQGALLSVLVSSQSAFAAEAAGIAPPATGQKTEKVQMDVRITESGKPFFAMSVDFSSMTSEEVDWVVASLSAAVDVYKPTAQRTKN